MNVVKGLLIQRSPPFSSHGSNVYNWIILNWTESLNHWSSLFFTSIPLINNIGIGYIYENSTRVMLSCFLYLLKTKIEINGLLSPRRKRMEKRLNYYIRSPQRCIGSVTPNSDISDGLHSVCEQCENYT